MLIAAFEILNNRFEREGDFLNVSVCSVNSQLVVTNGTDRIIQGNYLTVQLECATVNHRGYTTLVLAACFDVFNGRNNREYIFLRISTNTNDLQLVNTDVAA